jgi:hypothetical protein
MLIAGVTTIPVANQPNKIKHFFAMVAMLKSVWKFCFVFLSYLSLLAISKYESTGFGDFCLSLGGDDGNFRKAERANHTGKRGSGYRDFSRLPG